MYIFFTIIIVMAAILLILLVLVQNSKGGGLAAGFASGNMVMGAPKTADFLEKATWTMGGILVVLCLISSITLPKNSKEGTPKSEVSSQVEAVLPSAPAAEAPAATMETPAETPAE